MKPYMKTWEANPDSLIAETEIIGNKIYVALTNIGVARYDLSSIHGFPCGMKIIFSTVMK